MLRTMKNIRKRGIATVVAIALSIGAPAAAMAGSPTTTQYGGTHSQSNLGGGGGGLPLTGLDAVAIAAIGAALAGTGIAVRKLASAEQEL